MSETERKAVLIETVWEDSILKGSFMLLPRVLVCTSCGLQAKDIEAGTVLATTHVEEGTQYLTPHKRACFRAEPRRPF